MAYVDGILLPLQADKHSDYKEMAKLFAREARKVGGVSVECLGDGLEPGTLTSFPRAVQAQDGENVVFSFIIWPDKAAREKGWEALMANPELQPGADMPFDGKRMFWGGFTPLVGDEALAAMLASAEPEPAA